MQSPLHHVPLLVVVALAGCISDRPLSAEKDVRDAGRYRHHRILIWAIDKPTHRIRGFDDESIGPGREVALNPVEGHTVRVQAGPIEKVTITDFRSEWKEDAIRFKISHGTGSAEGTKDLTSPFLHMEYGGNNALASVAFAVPIGTNDSAPLLKLLKRKHAGTAAELEELLLVAAFELPHNDYIDLHDLLQVYKLLGRTERKDRWLALLEQGKPNEKISAAAILMSLGDEQATNVFCDAVLQAKGNRQVRLIEILSEMPRSDKALETAIELIVSPTIYRTKGPEGVDLPDLDRRYGLIRALTEKYPKENVRKHAGKLRRWAMSEYGKSHGGPMLLEFLENEQPKEQDQQSRPPVEMGSRTKPQSHDKPDVVRSFHAANQQVLDVDVDLASLIDVIQRERNANGEFSSDLSLIHGGGQTVHEQSLFQEWWHWIQGSWRNPGQFP